MRSRLMGLDAVVTGTVTLRAQVLSRSAQWRTGARCYWVNV